MGNTRLKLRKYIAYLSREELTCNIFHLNVLTCTKFLHYKLLSSETCSTLGIFNYQGNKLCCGFASLCMRVVCLVTFLLLAIMPVPRPQPWQRRFPTLQSWTIKGFQIQTTRNQSSSIRIESIRKKKTSKRKNPFLNWLSLCSVRNGTIFSNGTKWRKSTISFKNTQSKSIRFFIKPKI